MSGPRILLIGYGNPGRFDDGLGPALAEEVARRGIPGLATDSDYQLTVEDAEAVARHEVAILADAAAQGAEPFAWREVTATEEAGFTTHSVQPEQLLGLVRNLFGAKTKVYLLAIRGYKFNEFGEGLSGAAQANLAAATDFVEEWIRAALAAQGVVKQA